MQEILFKGFHECENGNTVITVNGEEKRGEWVEGSLVANEYIMTDKQERDFDIGGWYQGQMTEIIFETVCQYTGLPDKNNRKIFEGDIVKHGYTCKYSNGDSCDFYNNLPVSFSNNYGGYIVGNYNILTTKNIKKYSIEVIGNIFENPELLKGE